MHQHPQLKTLSGLKLTKLLDHAIPRTKTQIKGKKEKETICHEPGAGLVTQQYHLPSRPLQSPFAAQ